MIGLFDSGVGGLTGLRALRNIVPQCDVVYFGDLKNSPYGNSSQAEIRSYCQHAVSVLKSHGVDTVVGACNSVAAALHLNWVDLQGVAFTGIVGSNVQAFENTPGNILLFATSATVKSKVYQNVFSLYGRQVTVIALPNLASYIERGISIDKMRNEINHSMAGREPSEYQIVILGCTHYPLVKNIFTEIFSHGQNIFDPSVALAQRVVGEYSSKLTGVGKTKIILSQHSDSFKAQFHDIFPNEDAEFVIL